MKSIITLLLALIFSMQSNAQWNTNGSNVYYNGGSVGIGTIVPANRLEVFGSSFNRVSAIVNADVQTGFQAKRTGYNATDWELYVPSQSTDIRFHNAMDRLTLKADGNVGIGTTTPDSKLSVNGTIHSKEVKVDLTGWPDYVFEKEYQLQPLSEISKFIQENQRLPEMPSAKEVEENGVMLGEMNKLLLKKLEEVTLHLIRQQEEIDQLKNRLNSQN